MDRPPALEALPVEIRMVVAAMARRRIGDPATRRSDRPSIGVNIDLKAVFQSYAGETMREGATLSKTVS